MKTLPGPAIYCALNGPPPFSPFTYKFLVNNCIGFGLKNLFYGGD